MTISEILSKHYNEFLDICTKKDIALYGGKTSEDLLSECCLTLLKKYKNKELDEQDGIDILKKSFLEKCFFAYKKKTSKKETFIEYVPDYQMNIPDR